ncbi:MAG TPA: DinB family protein [Chitinophagaceae bacterium]|nr:DinB family protein [Chitinophagaceae bacterium]
MTRSINMANRIREVLLSGHWIANTNMQEQIRSVDWQQATFKVDTLNTIAALTYHLNYYLAGLIDAFENGKLEISDKYSFDLPIIDSAYDWDKLVSSFLQNSEMFAERIEQMQDDMFDKPFIDAKYGTVLRNIEGVIEHSYYHLGQITLIKKMILQYNKKGDT